MMRLEQTWRWYGPNDTVSLADVKQAGATGIVTALHKVPTGEVWTVEAIQQRQAEVAAAGLVWSVVESVPVHEKIKQGADDRDGYIANYQQSIRNLGACGIRKLCYNFMPVIDWTRTELDRVWSDGSRALAFDFTDFVAFEIHILKRPGAEAHYGPAASALAADRFAGMDAARVEALTKTVIAGLPGRMVEAYSVAEFQVALDAYKSIDAAGLRANLVHFLRAVVPVAEEAGVVMAIHPDDPPLPLLGLPRVVSTEDDVKHLLGAVDSRHNGLTFCVGSYGSCPENDVEGMAERYAPRVHFVHLRNVIKEGDGRRSFVESDHLGGDVDMFRVMSTMCRERARRAAEGWADPELPFRPDHGHQMLDDLTAGKKTNPGYTAIGRLRGLAELRGLMEGIVRAAAALE
eukprot:Transcript_13740.p1 GENE.Transcript_13740~~Transcript_13740.p1  ORF type:complete len:417 (-),score=174.11 Transcript_13740:104-1315(-)